MEVAGTVQNGVVVFVPGMRPPEGSVVRVVFDEPGAEQQQSLGSLWDDLTRLGKEAESLPVDLPEDLAINHDHYLYGAPKRA